LIDNTAYDLLSVNGLLQLMDELELILADTSNEELTPEKKIQYNNVSCSFLQFIYYHIAVSIKWIELKQNWSMDIKTKRLKQIV